MAQQTPNYKLSKPDANDPFGDFRQLFNDNMDKIDQIGGGSGGHTIVDENGADMPAEGKLQFTGNVTVSDDSINGKTVVNVTGGGGSANIVELTQAEYDALPDSKFSDDVVYLIKDALSASDAELTHVNGVFIDPNNVIVPQTQFRSSLTYVATEDCVVSLYLVGAANASTQIRIDGEWVQSYWQSQMMTTSSAPIFLKKGQTLTVSGVVSEYDSSYIVHGVQAGSNVTIIPDYASACYSTTEREVGCFVDGKPLYQKTVYYSGGANGNVTFSHGISDIDNIVSASGIAKDTDAVGEFIEFARIRSDGLNIGFSDITTTNVMYYVPSQFGSRIIDVYVTLRYTKTTDVAGSGNWTPLGKPTVHYSTDEQVIGTWIDGKPLYKKTVEINSVTYNDWTDVFEQASANIIGYDPSGSYAQLNNGERVQLDWFVTTSIYNRSIITNSGTKFRVETQGNNYSKIVATIQYTKTTN